ncbi:MAG: bifunctional alpha,alpha-trehalose-phosphate synthase (UDP-forming)/trehalose-phosphatase [Bacteriovoracaceae bacterium]
MARCLLVSNRLPIYFDEKAQSFLPSSGGLVSAIKGLDPKKIHYDFEWLGILTDDVADDKVQQLREKKFGNILCHPIIAPKNIYDDYYNKYCNNVLWPLFHYERSMVHHSIIGWKHYQQINQIVATAIANIAIDTDTVWIQDFHLMLVPGLLKEKRPKLKVGFFLHIPFPSSEIFRELPERKEILLSLLECDLVGLHDLSYLTNFKTSVQRILGQSIDNITERKLGVYPISIDVEEFERLASHPETQQLVDEYRKNKKEIKWILGIDRLDYIKGLIMKLKAFRYFLRHYPEYRGKVQMVQVVIPSRTDVTEYKQLKEAIEQIVSRINGEFGDPGHMPVHYLYHSISPHELSALYQVSEVLHVGSRRDGMNLVSLEYVVSQRMGQEGSILLSEFTGAHSTLSYALSINPWDVEGVAKKMNEAFKLSQMMKTEKMQAMQLFLKNYTSSDWASVFLRDLHHEVIQPKKIRPMSEDGYFPWMQNLRNKKILLFCDLDGTLIPITNHPSMAHLNEKTTKIIKELASNPHCELVIVSGRDKDFLQHEFIDRGLDFSFAACHGAYSISHKDHKWMNLAPTDPTKWKDSVLEVFKLYTLRTPGSFIEDKGHAVTWHYRNSPAAFAEFLANKLFIELEESLASLPVQVVRGKKVIEVKSIHANKGVFVQTWLQQLPPEERPDIIVAIGDDTTDEDMFSTLNDQKEIPSYCIKVGNENTLARYYINEQFLVNPLLEKISESIRD